MSLLTPSFGLLFWMVISFAIVFGLLAKFGFPVITQSVNERNEFIRQSLAKADEANRTLENIKQISEELIEEARDRQQALIKEATLEAGRLVQKAKEDAIIQGKQKLDEALKQIELQKRKAIGEIHSQIALLSINIAEKILRQQLDQPEKHEQMIAQFLDDIENSNTIKN
jgi:F-type H+-transporting ATPase subunit b